jgi:hypothetical protein
VKSRPILFSAPMVRALLAGTKTQTRRAVKWRGLEPGLNLGFSGLAIERSGSNWVLTSPTRTSHEYRSVPQPCPYGQPGDRLWVREAWRTVKHYDSTKPIELVDPLIRYEAGKSFRVDGSWAEEKDIGKLRPSMFMPRWASRIELEITQVRVERLQAISESDAVAEGAAGYEEGIDAPPPDDDQEWSYRASYSRLWESINGAGSWDLNPWVWCVSFEVKKS